jgi:hypothetical protein
MRNKHAGALSELIGAAWLVEQGYEVFRNVSQHGAIDLMAARGEEILRLDVKTCRNDDFVPFVTDEQMENGICILAVNPETRFCRVVEPRLPFRELMGCIGCGLVFLARSPAFKYCTERCGLDDRRRKRQAG